MGKKKPPAAARPPAAADVPEVLAWLHRQAAQILELPPARLRVDRSLAAHGLDSLAATELMAAIETGLGAQVDLGSLLEGPTLAQLAEQVARLLAAAAPIPMPVMTRARAANSDSRAVVSRAGASALS